MAAITFSKFDLGIDHRKATSVSDGNRLREMKNAYVTTGLATSKRPGMVKVAELEPGTKGLVAALGKLHTFYGMAQEEDVVHADTRFQANRLTCSDESLDTVVDVFYADVFNGFLYVAADHGTATRHHYLDYREDAEEEDGEEELDDRRFTEIQDKNCPHTIAACKIASKIFAVSPDGATVRFSKTGDPTVWTGTDDAGFLPTGLNARGDRSTNALGMYQNKLVALSRDSAQVWMMDPDPAAMALSDIVENVGTPYPESLATVAGDLYFLSDFGFRSITTQQLVSKLADLDIGSPIDTIVRPLIKGIKTVPRAAYFYGTGQYLCAIDRQMFVYSVSRTSRIAAWSRYELPFPIEGMAELEGVLYFRSGDNVYELSENASSDDGEVYEVVLEMPYMDFRSPGSLKRVYGLDLVMEGECYFSLGFDVRDPDAVTGEVRVRGNTRPGGMVPLQACGTEFSLRFRNCDDKPFRLDAVTVYYENMGTI